MLSIPLSVVELLATDPAHPAVDMLPGVVDVAQRVERAGYHRLWYAEHHSSALLADFPPAVVVAHVAAATSTIRVGSGGVLAVNHSALSLAEQFGTLAAFHPGRIDFGIGRGPGTFNPVAARALRRGAASATDEEYHENVAAILQYAGERPAVPEPWMLASSTAGATLAAALGLPLAFAYHLRPQGAAEAVERYREQFRPSRWCEAPRVMLGVQTICAETDAIAAALARPSEIVRAVVATRRVEPPMLDVPTAAAYEFTAEEHEVVMEARGYQAQGTAQAVRARLAEIASRFGADELVLITSIVDPKDRARSFELIMQGEI